MPGAGGVPGRACVDTSGARVRAGVGTREQGRARGRGACVPKIGAISFLLWAFYWCLRTIHKSFLFMRRIALYAAGFHVQDHPAGSNFFMRLGV